MVRYLFLAGRDTTIKVKNGSLVVGGETIPLERARFDRVIVSPGSGYFSLAAIRWLLTHKKSILFLGYRGRLEGELHPHVNARRSLAVRKAQYQMSDVIKMQLSRDLICAKLNRSLYLLGWLEQRFDRDFQTQREKMIKQQEKVNAALNRGQLLNVEAQVARQYWSCVRECLPKRFGFEARTRLLRGYTNPQHAKDRWNCLLNYSYSILAGEVAKACYSAGFDPFEGFYHECERGLQAFTYDYIEAYRWLVEQALIKDQNKYRQVWYRDSDAVYYLSSKGTRMVLDSAYRALYRETSYKGRKRPWVSILVLKLLELGAFLEGRCAEFTFDVPAPAV
jgi:CRISPR-associated protein Cas1